MSFRRLTLLLLFLPFAVYAQTTTITGKVTIAGTQMPLGKVSVFLSNSSFGTETDENGNFTLVDVKPGQYDLVASSVGYEEYSQSILVGAEPIHLDIPMKQSMNQLRGVVISTYANWKRNYEQFKKDFIGASENAKECEVVNPRTMNFIYHGKSHELEGWSNDFLVIDNKALGYRVKFLVDTFSSSGLTGNTEWAGKAVFEEMPGSATQKREWKKKREEVYYGSIRNFLRSLYMNTLMQDGFIMYKLTRELNPNRPSEGLILQKIKQFREMQPNRDSLNFWIDKDNMSKYYHEHLDKTPLTAYQVFAKTDKPGLFILSFSDCLYVVYTRRHEETDFKDVYRPLDMENFETSILTLPGPYAVFDMNGVIVGGTPLIQGTWSKSRIAELLPFDYSPDDDKDSK
ncbi:MAG TPA: carboxypeptidase-like regulatory domain-containing protein [Mucilaginibacter sp.]|nr:carboxypeptidase-like regulatory domain-containing protein [Mucilaginibacter sp.]